MRHPSRLSTEAERRYMTCVLLFGLVVVLWIGLGAYAVYAVVQRTLEIESSTSELGAGAIAVDQPRPHPLPTYEMVADVFTALVTFARPPSAVVADNTISVTGSPGDSDA